MGEAQILVDTCAQSLELTPLQVSQKHEGASHAAFLFSQKASLLCSFGFNHSEMRAIQRRRWNKGPLWGQTKNYEEASNQEKRMGKEADPNFENHEDQD